MQNLYMMATLVREQQMRKMAIEINQGSINIEQAMIQYNVSTREAVMERLENLKAENKQQSVSGQSESIDLNIMAA